VEQSAFHGPQSAAKVSLAFALLPVETLFFVAVSCSLRPKNLFVCALMANGAQSSYGFYRCFSAVPFFPAFARSTFRLAAKHVDMCLEIFVSGVFVSLFLNFYVFRKPCSSSCSINTIFVDLCTKQANFPGPKLVKNQQTKKLAHTEPK